MIPAPALRALGTARDSGFGSAGGDTASGAATRPAPPGGHSKSIALRSGPSALRAPAVSDSPQGALWGRTGGMM